MHVHVGTRRGRAGTRSELRHWPRTSRIAGPGTLSAGECSHGFTQQVPSAQVPRLVIRSEHPGLRTRSLYLGVLQKRHLNTSGTKTDKVSEQGNSLLFSAIFYLLISRFHQHQWNITVCQPQKIGMYLPRFACNLVIKLRVRHPHSRGSAAEAPQCHSALRGWPRHSNATPIPPYLVISPHQWMSRPNPFIGPKLRRPLSTKQTEIS